MSALELARRALAAGADWVCGRCATLRDPDTPCPRCGCSG